MATEWVTRGNLKGPPGDPAPPADGGYRSGLVPAGSTTPVVQHSLGTQDIIAVVREVATGLVVGVAYESVDDTGALSDNHVRFSFATAPTSGQYRYVILSAAPASTASGEHTHASAEISGLVDLLDAKADDAHTHTIPASPYSWVSFSSASTITLDAAVGNMFRGSVTTDPLIAPPLNGTDAQRVMISLQASGADRTVSLGAAIVKVTGLEFPAVVPSGKRLFLGLLLDGSTWYLLAAGLEP